SSDLHDLHEVGAHERLAALDRHHAAAERGEPPGHVAPLGGRQLLAGRHAVGPEVAERALHVAAVGHLHQALERPAPQHAAREGQLADERGAHGKAQPARNWRPSRRVTSATKRGTSRYSSSTVTSVSTRSSISPAVIVSGGSSLSTSQR